MTFLLLRLVIIIDELSDRDYLIESQLFDTAAIIVQSKYQIKSHFAIYFFA